MNDKVEGQGRVVTLPDGTKRIDFIRDNYYNKKTHVHDDTCMSRSDIKKAINEQLPEGEAIPYQIVFAATKTPEDPRVAAEARAKERAEAKAAKDAEKAAAKAAAAAEKEKAAKAAAAEAAKAAKAKK